MAATKRKKYSTTIIKATLLLIVLAFFIVAGAGLGLLASWIKATPAFDPSKLKPNETSFVYDAKGKLVTELHAEENRVVISIDDMPKYLKDAFVSIEDQDFEKHFGINIKNILGSLWTDIKHGEIVRGASTITQQLARNAFLEPDKDLLSKVKRKVQEAWLAIQLEKKYTKDEILEFYLNHIYFGHSASGVQAASKTFFGKTVDKLSLAESAMLAGIPKGPSIYSPYNNFEKAKQRQEIILNKMVELKAISKEEADKAKQETISLIGLKKSKETYRAPFFVDNVVLEVVKQLQPALNISEDEAFNKVYNGGLRIYTTMDFELQEIAERVMADENNYPESVPDKNGVPQPQAAIVVLDPHTGHVKAMVGGRNHESRLALNRSTQSYRQPGSAFKPIAVYTGAIDMGMTAGTVIDDTPVFYPQVGGKTWSPENFTRRFDGLTTIRRAIENSVNVVAVKVLDSIGIDRGIEYAQKLGIKSLVLKGSRNDKNLSTALGGLTKGVSPLELASAYGTLANKGVHIEPITVLKVTDKAGRVLYENKPEKWVAVDEATAYIMTDMLRGVVTRGTGTRLSDLDFYPVGKTGTTSDNKDVWWVGYTPHLVAAVWMGYDEPKPMSNVAGGKQPALIWKQVMQAAHKKLPKTPFEKSSDIIGPIQICADSGKLATELCTNDPRGPRVISEYFIKGTEPKEYCDVHVVKQVCTETGMLATNYCPSYSVVNKVFIQRKEPWVPAENGRIPTDAKFEVPIEYCDIHGPFIPDLNFSNNYDDIQDVNY
jgi:penicillin-binding protein 1A